MKQVLRTLALLCAMLLLVGGVSFATSTVESWGPFTFYSNSERSLVTQQKTTNYAYANASLDNGCKFSVGKREVQWERCSDHTKDLQ